MDSESLWVELHDLFDTDDGSLPEIRIDHADVGALVAGYALLRGRAARLAPEHACFSSTTRDEGRPLDSVPNAAALVVSGEAHPFHVVLGGIQSRGVTLPDLGVFVFPDQLALDYRMGSGWGPGELQALFELLADLGRLDPGATLSLEEGVPAEVSTRFQRVWRRWHAMRAQP